MSPHARVFSRGVLFAEIEGGPQVRIGDCVVDNPSCGFANERIGTKTDFSADFSASEWVMNE
jgi:hypothetical protein